MTLEKLAGLHAFVHSVRMPEKRPKRPRDPNQLARHILGLATGEVVEKEPGRSAAAELGSKGGKARAKALGPKRRSEIAKKAASSRWSKN